MRYIVIIFAVLFFSCSKKVTTSTSVTLDSTFIEESVRFDTVFIASDTVRLKEWIECDSVTNQPKPFKAFGKTGRASVRVTVKKNGDLIVVSACDSLMKVIAVLDREVFRLRQEKKVVMITTQPSKLKVWFNTMCQIMAGILVLIIIYFIYKVIRPKFL